MNKWPEKIYTLDNSQPHANYKGWKGFLKTCKIKNKCKRVIFFVITNCNYILFPSGLLVCNYGFHGQALMNEIRDSGVVKVKNELVKSYNEFQKIINELN